MKKLLLSLCVSLLFSCGENTENDDKEKVQTIDTTYVNGDRYVGEWKYDKQHGQGTYTYGKRRRGVEIGDKYVGEFINGDFHVGTYFYMNGDRYIGEWARWTRHGKGKMIYDGGRVKEGLWEFDSYIGKEHHEKGEKKEKKKEKKKKVDEYKDSENNITTPPIIDEIIRDEIPNEITRKESILYGKINDPDGYTNVREKKSGTSKIIFEVYEDERFEIIDNRDDNWWLIEYDGEQGYIYRDRIDIVK